MTNIQQFSLPDVEVKFNKDADIRNLSEDIQIKEIIWGSLLGRNNNDLDRSMFLKDRKFLDSIDDLKKKFIKNPSKYPSMKNEDWE
jgi:hypothetical protein